MSDYFACLDLINFKMSSALLALSPLGCAVGAVAGAEAVHRAVVRLVADLLQRHVL